MIISAIMADIITKYFLLEHSLQTNYGWKQCNNSTIRDDCVICLEGLNNNSPIYELPCGDKFHTECIYTDMLTRKVYECPNCRQPYTMTKPVEQLDTDLSIVPYESIDNKVTNDSEYEWDEMAQYIM